MSVSTEASICVLPDFTSAEFHRLDLPSQNKRTGSLASSVSFTSWRSHSIALEGEQSSNSTSAIEQSHSLSEFELEACDSAFLQGRYKAHQMRTINEGPSEEITFPRNIIPSSPRLLLTPREDENEHHRASNRQLNKNKAGESSRFLYRSHGLGNSGAVATGWIKVEFWITKEEFVELEFSVVDEASRAFFMLEKEREDQFYNRNEHAMCEIDEKLKKSFKEATASETEDEFADIPSCNEDGIDEQSALGHHILNQGWESKASRFIKSVSMTTLIRSGDFEQSPNYENEQSVDIEYNENSAWYTDGIKSFQSASRSLSPEFGFCSMQYASNTAWSTTTPKLRRNINKKIKTKWQPVSRFVSRCYVWDGCSSVDSSTRKCSFSLGTFLRRIICCGAVVSSDDETVR